MAYKVLLHFDDEEQALNFVDDALDESVIWARDGHDQRPVAVKVEAIYKAPTLFCPGCTTGKKSGMGFTMGQKWGWWVCVVCKKPSKLYWESVVEKQSSFGKNLLKRLFTEDSPV